MIIKWNGNVIRFPDQNTLSTRVKQIRNPQKEISGGFLLLNQSNSIFENFNSDCETHVIISI